MFAAYASSGSDETRDAGARLSAAAKPADDRGPPLSSVVDKAVQRLEEVVEQETAALRSRARIDLQDYSNRKSQGLLELTRALRTIDGATADRAVLERLAALRAKLEANRAVLKMHLDAVREVSTAVAEAMRAAESDGTYSPSIRGGNRP